MAGIRKVKARAGQIKTVTNDEAKEAIRRQSYS